MNYTEILTAIIVFAFGITMGSFLNVVIWRLPREEQIAKGRSHCPFCSKELKAIDLIPVLSFLIQGGKCRYCTKRISYRYPLIELLVGALFLASYWVLGPAASVEWFTLVKFLFVISVLVAVFVIDLEHFLILDKIVLPATVIILGLHLISDILGGGSLLHGQTTYGILGAIAGYLPFYLLWKVSNGKWIGLGDAKLGLFLGAVFGFPLVWLTFFMAFLIGSLVAIPLLASGAKSMTSKIPLGSFLSVAGIITLWFGEAALHWYLALIGFGA